MSKFWKILVQNDALPPIPFHLWSSLFSIIIFNYEQLNIIFGFMYDECLAEWEF